MLLREISDWIILAAGVIGAITAIYKAIGKPIKFFDKRRKERQREEIIELLDSLMPHYFEPIYIELEDIKKLNASQEQIIDLLKRNLQDMLRQQIEEIYEIHQEQRSLPWYVKENLKELYADYKAAGGNHHIDRIYARMDKWPVTDESIELKEEEQN